MRPRGASAAIELLLLIRAGRISQSIGVVARLGVADHLTDGPRGADELAAAVGADPLSLQRLLRMLTEVGVFAEPARGRFALTPLGALLRSDEDASLRSMAMLLESPFLRDAWTNLIHTARTGDPAFDHTHGRHLFEHLGDHPDDAALFDRAMADVSRQLVATVVDVYDFGRFRTVVDVGGGNGALLAEILARHPGGRGILYDRPDVAGRARELLAAAGLDDRCEVIEGDFFVSVPPGGDAYLLTRVIHDWDDAPARRILANCRAVMRPDARLVLAEAVPRDGTGSLLAKLVDVEMLAIGGRERTEAEYRDLLAGAGLRLTQVIESDGQQSLIEAVPV